MPIDRDGDGPPLRREDARPASRSPATGDLRATAFTDDVFDDEYYGRRKRSGSGFGLVVGVVFGAAVAAAAGWYVFGSREPGKGGGGPSDLVKADPNPYKIKPENPGGLQVENQDKLVYERMAKAAPQNRVENLLPAAEEPKAPPVRPKDPEPKPEPKVEAKPPAEASVAKAEPAAAPAAPIAPAPASEAPATKAPAPASTEDPLAKLVAEVAPGRESVTGPVAAKPAPAAKAPLQLVPDAPAPPAVAVPSAPQYAAVAPSAPIGAKSAAPAPGPAAAPAAAAAPVAGALYLQLASTRSEDAALGEWKRISGKNADVLAGLSPTVTKAEVPDKGTFFRLRAGPVPDKATADSLCASLTGRSVGCMVIKP